MNSKGEMQKQFVYSIHMPIKIDPYFSKTKSTNDLRKLYRIPNSKITRKYLAKIVQSLEKINSLKNFFCRHTVQKVLQWKILDIASTSNKIKIWKLQLKIIVQTKMIRESCYHRIKHQKIQDYKYCFTHVKEAAAGGVL